MAIEKLSDVLDRLGGAFAATKFNRKRQVLERMAEAGALVIDGKIYTEAQTRVRKTEFVVNPGGAK
jgi:predicted SpoU family rRNA methylase